MVSVLCEIQTALFKIWTLAIRSIPNIDNHYMIYSCILY